MLGGAAQLSLWLLLLVVGALAVVFCAEPRDARAKVVVIAAFVVATLVLLGYSERARKAGMRCDEAEDKRAGRG